MRWFLILMVALAFAGPAWSAGPGTARLSLVKGDVQVYTGEDDEWFPATQNMILKQGDRIWVPDNGRAEVHLLGGIYLRLDARTALDILTLEEESHHFSLQQGHAYINNRKGGIDYIQIETPTASIGCYDNSIVLVDVDESGSTDLSVLKGYSQTETEKGKTRVSAGSILRVAETMGTEIFPLGKPDSWERWNHDRDNRLARGSVSLRYLPDELDDFVTDFDDNGSWTLVEEYGYVWTPRVTVVDWAPYRSGRWIWTMDQFVWISYDPWGWAPHHYGRWIHIPSRGWCWVPPPRNSVVWAPGYVGWTYTSSNVAWVPLAPGEVYYGYRGRDHREIAVNQPVSRFEFRNVRVRNGVTVINRDAFVYGRRGDVIRMGGENLFTRPGATFAPPPFRPVRSANAPVIRTIAPERRPPLRIRQLTVNQIRQERGLLHEEKGSAFSPGRVVPPLPVKERTLPPRIVRPPQPATVLPGQNRHDGQVERKGRQRIQRQERQPVPPIRARSGAYSLPAASPPAAVRNGSQGGTGVRQPPPRREGRPQATEGDVHRPDTVERQRRGRE